MFWAIKANNKTKFIRSYKAIFDSFIKTVRKN